MNLYIYLGLAIAFIASAGGAYLKIHHDGYVEGSAEVKAQWNEANKAARQKELDASDAAEKALALARKAQKTQIVQRTVYVDKIVDHPIYNNQCFDPNGMRCLRAAIDGKSPDGCKPTGTVPGAATSG